MMRIFKNKYKRRLSEKIDMELHKRFILTNQKNWAIL